MHSLFPLIVHTKIHRRDIETRWKENSEILFETVFAGIRTAFDAKRIAGPNSYFTGCDCCEYKISCINFRIFESISRKSENYDLSVFFAGSAELWPRKNCSRRNADRCAFPSAVRDLISYRFYAIYSRRRQRYSNKIIKILLYIKHCPGAQILRQ